MIHTCINWWTDVDYITTCQTSAVKSQKVTRVYKLSSYQSEGMKRENETIVSYSAL